jgi:DNA polymerase phi
VQQPRSIRSISFNFEATPLDRRIASQLAIRSTFKMGFKRRREHYNVDTKLVEIYEDLASEKDEIRLKAAQGLVSQFTPDKEPTDDQIKKVLVRLFRGLCSPRKAARIGFSIALTEVLTQIFAVKREDSEITLERVISLWERQTNATAGESGQVRRALEATKSSHANRKRE